MQVTPVLARGLDLNARLSRKPVDLLRIGEGQRREIDLGAESFQADILQSVGDACFDLCDRTGLRVDPCGSASSSGYSLPRNASAAGDFMPGMCSKLIFCRTRPPMDSSPARVNVKACE